MHSSLKSEDLLTFVPNEIMDIQQDWFTSWFNTPYYHILYKNRNDKDAQFFMRNITNFLKLKQGSTIADVPCGKGRHSVYLNSLGYTVRGGDLSSNSIAFAQQFANETLQFEVWDMRKPIQNSYDAIFNLFTSFGYFENDEEDILILQNFKNGLAKEGVFVLDFLNVHKVANHLVAKEVKEIDDIEFHITKEIKDGFILKHINFVAEKQKHAYTEHVKFLTLPKMQHYFAKAGLTITHVFGDYSLQPFHEETSDRLILVAQ